MIIVSLTSWTKRIGNVRAVVASLLDQTMMPDRIEINLSLDEFPKRTADLPSDLQKFILDNSKIVKVNWVKGNDGVFKKFIPTLKKYPLEKFYLLSCDDDWIYRKDYIKLMMFYLDQFKADTFCLANAKVIGNRQIYKPGVFKPDFYEKLTKDVIDTRIDDMYIDHYLTSKGKKFASFRPDDTPDITKRYNQIFPNSHNDENGEYSIHDINKASSIIKKIKF